MVRSQCDDSNDISHHNKRSGDDLQRDKKYITREHQNNATAEIGNVGPFAVVTTLPILQSVCRQGEQGCDGGEDEFAKGETRIP